MSILRVSSNNAFSRYACITSHYTDPLTPLLHDCRCHRPFLQIRKLTHISAKILIGVLDDFGWEGKEDLEDRGGGVFRSHHVIWEVGKIFHERRRAQIHTGSPFQSIYLCVLDLLLLFHLPVLSNQSALRFHLCSDIDPRWGVRVHSSSFFLFIPVWNPYHSPLPRFHLICLNFLNGDNCPLLDSIVSCSSNKEVPWWSPLCSKDNHWGSHPNEINFFRCHRGPRNLFDFFWFRPRWCLGCC